jgi:outer membrane lipase/esterase
MKKMNARPILSWLTLGLVAIALSGCGGGEQARKFRPTKIVSFGDESSAFAPVDSDAVVDGSTVQGLKYTVNSLSLSKSYIKNADSTGLTRSLPAVPSGGTISSTQPTWIDFPDNSKALGTPDAWVPVGSTTPAYFYIERLFSLDVAYKDASNNSQVDSNRTITYQYLYACTENRIWIQVLANAYGLSYNVDCPLDARGGATSYAHAADKVADTILKINANLANVNGDTLATVLAGQHDVLEKYEALYAVASVPTEAAVLAAEADLRGRGQQLGQAVNNLANRGARVLLSTLPDLSYSPRVQLNADLSTRTDAALRAAVMKRLLEAYNAGMFSENGVRNDGHSIVIVKAFEMTQNMARSPGSFGLIDGTKPVCVAASLRSIDTTTTVTPANASSDLRYCNTYTLREAPSSDTPYPEYDYLWALDTWLSPAGHASLGNLAYQRADGDTF